MERNLIIISTLLLILIVPGCNHPDKVKNSVKSEPVKDTTAANHVVVARPSENSAAQIYAKPEIPVLCYHRITDARKGDYTVSLATFSADMKVLADSGYHSVSPAQLYDYLVFNKALPPKPVMITFDDSRAEHSEIAAPVLEKHGFRGVFFIMTITYNKKNYMTTEQIAKLVKAGHTIGLHSWDHTMVTKYKEAVDWQKEVVAPKEKLEKIAGSPVEYWAYPNGVYDHKGAEELSKYFKLSFILYSKRDSVFPLQTVRRVIVPESSPQGLLKLMHRAFGSSVKSRKG
jgi:peptidoglycan/xylan/chitin deacetylase (PgdA/CDA1 family)